MYSLDNWPKWRNGRRAGLKNQWGNSPCRFDSGLRHQRQRSGSWIPYERFYSFATPIVENNLINYSVTMGTPTTNH